MHLLSKCDPKVKARACPGSDVQDEFPLKDQPSQDFKEGMHSISTAKLRCALC